MTLKLHEEFFETGFLGDLLNSTFLLFKLTQSSPITINIFKPTLSAFVVKNDVICKH